MSEYRKVIAYLERVHTESYEIRRRIMCALNILHGRQTIYKTQVVNGILVRPKPDSGVCVCDCVIDGPWPEDGAA
jgi:NAD kinase